MQSNQSRLRALDRARKQRHFKHKQESAPWVACKCGCGERIRAIDAYGRPKSYVNGHSRRKYSDPKEHKRVYARKRFSDPLLKQRELEKKQHYHHQRKVALIKHMGGKCAECNLAYDGQNGAVFQFHHVDPADKTDRITFWWSWERILAEAVKCHLVCANCHFLIHGGSY